MSRHPAIQPGHVAVVTGAASGIGRAAAECFATLGLRVVLSDIDEAALREAGESVARAAGRPDAVLTVTTDVSRREDVERLRDEATGRFGPVSVLMNNAGIEAGGRFDSGPDVWHRIMDVNFWGAVNGIGAFVPAMAEAGTPGLVICTGSKQGITTPPGNTPYNASKAALKVVTEGLAHELRERGPACRVTAHLLIPGFVFTGLTRRRGVTEKPAAAWTPEQTIDFMMASLERGDFYILCPDNDVSRDTDERRIAWAAGDIVENRPALSRWDARYTEAFAAYMKT